MEPRRHSHEASTYAQHVPKRMLKQIEIHRFYDEFNYSSYLFDKTDRFSYILEHD